MEYINYKNKNHLKSVDKRTIGILSYYKFLKRLKFKCYEYNVPLIITEEAYTSKACCKCTTLCEKFTKRKLNCNNCGYSIDRDINGSINLLFKNL